MEVTAKLKYLRTSPKKVRLVIDVARGMKVEEALVQLNMINKKATKPVAKLINSAIANGVHNFGLEKDNLYIKEVTANDGPTLKRWMPRAHGRATTIRKRTTHIDLVLAEIVESKEKDRKKRKKEIEKQEVDEKPTEAKKDKAIPSEKAELKEQALPKDADKEKGAEIHDVRMEGKHRHNQHSDKRNQKGKGGFMKKLFNRKSG